MGNNFNEKTSKFHSKHHNQKWYYELTLIFAKYAFNSFSELSYACLALQIFPIPIWRFCSHSSYTYRWNYEKKLKHRTCFDFRWLLFGGSLHLLLQENSTRSQEEEKNWFYNNQPNILVDQIFERD